MQTSRIFKLCTTISRRNFSQLNFKNKNVEFLSATTRVFTNKEAIDSDYGLKQFINKTYVCTGGGILATLGGGFLVGHDPSLLAHFPYLLGGGFVTSIAGMHCSQYYKIQSSYNKF